MVAGASRARPLRRRPASRSLTPGETPGQRTGAIRSSHFPHHFCGEEPKYGSAPDSPNPDAWLYTAKQTADFEAAMADFMTHRRPPEEIRDRLDLGWRIEGQSVLLLGLKRWNQQVACSTSKGGGVNGMHESVWETASIGRFK